MYLKQVTIENFRGIEEMTLEFMPGVNLVIGDNGVGKTTVLEAIAAGLRACFTNIPDITVPGIKAEDVRQELQVVDDSPSVKYHSPLRVTCEAEIGDRVYSWSRVRRDTKTSRAALEFHSDERITDWFSNAANDLDTPLPILNYQSIQRIAADKQGDFGSSRKRLDDRRYGYADCLDASLDDKFIRKWCYAMMRKAHKSSRYDLFCQAVVRMMRRMNENQFDAAIYFSEEFGMDGDFVYEENGRVVPISFLSAGYQSTLWMVMDIACRALMLNPGTRSLDEITGIVLIDEVDNHLHPKWQWNVVDALRDTFPNVQFIITTHAPIVIASCKDAAILTIDAKPLVLPGDPVYGYKIEDVIERTQGSPAAIKALKDLYVDFEDACIRKDVALAQQFFDRLEREFPRSTERAKAQTRLRFLKLGG